MDPEEVETASIRSGSAVLSHQSVELLPDHDGEVATDVIHIEGDKEPDENQFPKREFKSGSYVWKEGFKAFNT